MSTQARPPRLDLSRTPLAYPGDAVESSLLLLPDCSHRLIFRAGRRLGQARVERCGSCAAKDGLRIVPLNYELLCWNVASMDGRYAVVAVGSNANADVLRSKMERAGAEPVVPMVIARLDNLAVAYSAHISRPGFIPAAPVHAPGQSCEVVVGFLDREQLAHMDATEPNYVRRWLTSPEHPLLLDGGERLGGFHIYDSRWGVLAEEGAALPLNSQASIAAWLDRQNVVPWAGQEPQAAVAALGNDPALRDQLGQLLAERRLVAPARLDGPEFAGHTYGDTASGWPDQVTSSASSLRATGTRHVERRGQQCIVVHSMVASRLGLSAHAEIRSALRSDAPGVIARVILDDQQAEDAVGVDQLIRNALGLELEEHVELAPIYVPASPTTDLLVARPHYVACRVQAADLATVEQEVALLSPLTLSLLGIQPGARVVLEGVPRRPADAVPVVRVKAHEAPPEILDRRTQFSGGGYESRFPSSRDSLAVFPDLPWIFLDAATRARLGLGSHRLSAIRIRAARGDQALSELRELMLLVILAAVGVATVIPSAVWLSAFLGALLLVTGLVARARLRRRLAG
jgi:hypothetical protein